MPPTALKYPAQSSAAESPTESSRGGQICDRIDGLEQEEHYSADADDRHKLIEARPAQNQIAQRYRRKQQWRPIEPLLEASPAPSERLCAGMQCNKHKDEQQRYADMMHRESKMPNTF